uniref:Uncharacterized protein n=1 Tax=Arundo donax TaxID=35708 RepID=A0A0A9AW83_ARUDO
MHLLVRSLKCPHRQQALPVRTLAASPPSPLPQLP